MYLLGVKKDTKMFFYILASFFCVAWMSVRLPSLKLRPSPALVSTDIFLSENVVYLIKILRMLQSHTNDTLASSHMTEV